jgi:hypothetical protein
MYFSTHWSAWCWIPSFPLNLSVRPRDGELPWAWLHLVLPGLALCPVHLRELGGSSRFGHSLSPVDSVPHGTVSCSHQVISRSLYPECFLKPSLKKIRKNVTISPNPDRCNLRPERSAHFLELQHLLPSAGLRNCYYFVGGLVIYLKFLGRIAIREISLKSQSCWPACLNYAIYSAHT